ncbi:MAG: hypothetical protein JW803_03580 [Endomicrobiales bacterium]|nr:hypothetical protein [Endomicrobiales bacterium]
MKKILGVCTCLFILASCAGAYLPSGNIEYLGGHSSVRDTPVNPSNALSFPSFTSVSELRLNILADDRKMFNLETRGRYDFIARQSSGFLDQAYVNFRLSDMFTLKAGRQRISFGTGYLWNPVNDLDIEKDIYNPDKYTEGVDALKLGFDLTDKVSEPLGVYLEIVPPVVKSWKTDPEYSKIGLQFYALHQNIECGFAASHKRNENSYDSTLLGIYGSLDIQGIIAGSEVSYSKSPGRVYFTKYGTAQRDGHALKGTLSLNKRVSEKSFVIVEYFHNGAGLDKDEFDDMTELLENDYDTYAPVVIDSLKPGYASRNYFFAAISLEASDFWAVSLNTMSNLDRYGSFFYPQLSWTKINDLTLTLEAIFNVSSGAESEFSLLPYGSAVFLRTQYYF